MAVALAFAAPAATAGFLYVPPEAPAAEAARAAGSDAAAGPGGNADAPGGDEHGPATVETKAEDPVPGVWRVRSGEMLRETLVRWGGRARVEVLFLTDRRYRLHEAREFRGSFSDSAEALFAALSHVPHPPVGEIRADSRTLAVLHRMRGSGDER